MATPRVATASLKSLSYTPPFVHHDVMVARLEIGTSGEQLEGYKVEEVEDPPFSPIEGANFGH